MKTFNLNSYMKVKLTEHGVKLLEETTFGHYELANHVENNIWEVQMWKLMYIVGKYMCSSEMRLPIKMEIFIDEKWIGDSEDVNSI